MAEAEITLRLSHDEAYELAKAIRSDAAEDGRNPKLRSILLALLKAIDVNEWVCY